MIEIENTEVFGWEAAIRGMRNPMNSWDNSDSVFGNTIMPAYDKFGEPDCSNCKLESELKIGANDMMLMQSLCKAGSDHRKFMRMINVTVDITAPLYWWKEYDTYKVGTVANSCSTMHKIAAKPFELDDFSHEHLQLLPLDMTGNMLWNFIYVMNEIIAQLNMAREMYIKTKDNRYWWQMIQILPSSYNQRRTIQLNYEVLLNIYHARKAHKLDEWHAFCGWIDGLPYANELIVGEKAE